MLDRLACRGAAPSFENRRGVLPAAARSIRVANHNRNRLAARSSGDLKLL